MTIEQIIETYGRDNMMIDDGDALWTPCFNSDEWVATGEFGWTCNNADINRAGIEGVEIYEEGIVMVSVKKSL